MRRHLVAALLLALLIVIGAFAQTSPLEGTWKLNVAKSKYSPGPPPKSQTLTWERVQGGFRFSNDSVGADGRETHSVTMEKDDGSYAPVEGGAAGLTRSLRRIDDRTYEDADKVNGKATTTRRLVLSADGRTLTNTMTGTTTDGQPMNSVVVYEKQ